MKTNADVARNADIVFLCVTGAPQVEEYVNGKDIASVARRGLVVIDTSTSEPATTTKMREALAEKGVRFVDAPLARTPVEAELGKLNIMVGADDATFAELKPVLAAFCENIIHAGPAGHGIVLKLINNFLAMAIANASAEACAAAAKSGLSIRKLHDVVSAGAVNSGIFQMIVGKMLDGDLTGWRPLVERDEGLALLHAHGGIAAGVGDHGRGRAPEPASMPTCWASATSTSRRCSRRKAERRQDRAAHRTAVRVDHADTFSFWRHEVPRAVRGGGGGWRAVTP